MKSTLIYIIAHSKTFVKSFILKLANVNYGISISNLELKKLHNFLSSVVFCSVSIVDLFHFLSNEGRDIKLVFCRIRCCRR